MKIEVKRLPRVKLADLLEKHGLKLVVEQMSIRGCQFKASIPRLIYYTSGSGGLSRVTAHGIGETPYRAIERLCSGVDGYFLAVSDLKKKNAEVAVGPIELIPPSESEIEEV